MTTPSKQTTQDFYWHSTTPGMKQKLSQIEAQLKYSGCDKDYDRDMYNQAYLSVLLTLKREFKGKPQCRINNWERSNLLNYFDNKNDRTLIEHYRMLSINLFFDSESTPRKRTTLGPIIFRCHYCDGTASLKKFDVLKRRFGQYGYICDSGCDASVSFHKGDSMPMGSLANKELRILRSQCMKLLKEISRKNQVNESIIYRKLSEILHLNYLDIKIARLAEEQCRTFIREITKLVL
ncbi:zinc-finger-containing protein [Bowmanella yangjiangensis]|uniref:Uncharacterized protein n=1 Tax=Bowmanella yangjiangensis TaxID=2811230 RepID=A0ABS3CQG7_9ALTE|nr:zinc-finger-containing protein [Bowmanella yangjiangensis]MBN7819332.1 hypothetical protein [Bowmanella yangjiangensis]